MTTRMLLSLGLSTLVLGGTTVGCAAAGNGGAIASAGTQAPAGDGTKAGANAGRAAGRALAKRDAVSAVGFAEAAVASAPGRADYRMLLAQSYLQAGRFQSARDAFGDVLRLSPDDGKAALNLALTQIATGDWHTARMTLDAHAGRIAPSDIGLAMALAGDPAGAVKLLTAAAREPGADAKVRQNLGLALALSGQWPMARAVAAADLSPADVDGRMEQWALFAQPQHASDQVAALLGVRPVEDRGQPVALALVAPVATGSATSAVAAIAAPERSSATPAAALPIAVPVAVVPVATESTRVAAPTLSAARIVFAPRQEVVQPLPPIAAVPLLRASATPMKVAAPRATGTVAGGDWFVQLGAFADPRGAHDAWGQATHRFAALGGHQPQSMMIRARSGMLYRLSVGGFDRVGADTLCGRYKAQGGVCFVRRGAGDQMAQWLRKPAMQLASR